MTGEVGGRGGRKEEKQQCGEQQDVSWEQVLSKARDCGEDDPLDGRAACSCLGTRSVPRWFPSFTTNPERGNMPHCQ